MARNFIATIGECKADNLAGDNLVFQKRVPVKLTAAGTYSRGQLLVLDPSGDEASLPTASTVAVDCILLDDVGEIDGLEEVEAAVSLTGEFNENAVLWGGITEANQAAVKKAAAEKQLYIAPMAKAPFVQFGEGK